MFLGRKDSIQTDVVIEGSYIVPYFFPHHLYLAWASKSRDYGWVRVHVVLAEGVVEMSLVFDLSITLSDKSNFSSVSTSVGRVS